MTGYGIAKGRYNLRVRVTGVTGLWLESGLGNLAIAVINYSGRELIL